MPSYLLEPTPECLGGERGASAELVDHPSPGERDSSPTHPLSWETIVGMTEADDKRWRQDITMCEVRPWQGR